MANKSDDRDKLRSFLHRALHELHQASMYAQGVDHTDVGRLISSTEKLKEHISRLMSDAADQHRRHVKRAAAAKRAGPSAAKSKRAKSKK